MRADISMTVFLNNPEDYDNGELIMNSRINPQAIKLPAGDAFIYPTGEFHRVEPVTRGVRSVAISWIQSIIRDTHQRQFLTDIWTAMDGVSKLTPDDKLDENQPYRSLSMTHWGLLRLWRKVEDIVMIIRLTNLMIPEEAAKIVAALDKVSHAAHGRGNVGSRHADRQVLRHRHAAPHDRFRDSPQGGRHGICDSD